MTVVITSTAGDILLAHAMKALDLDHIIKEKGLGAAIVAVLKTPTLSLGVLCMALSFFSLLFALSAGELSLIAPATASLTVVATTIAAKVFLKERVSRRRWVAALLVCAGAALLQ